MKKLVVFASLLISSVSLFAFDRADWMSNIYLGLGFPIFKTTLEYSGKTEDAKGFGVGFDLKSQAIHLPSGFVVQAGLGLGGARIEDFYAGDPQWGFDLNGELGLGYAFIRNKKTVLSLAGVFGYDFSVFKKKVLYNYGGYLYNAEMKSKQMVFFLGADLSGTYRFSERLGIYGSILVGIPLFGFGTQSASNDYRTFSIDINAKAGGFYIKPSIGLSISLD